MSMKKLLIAITVLVFSLNQAVYAQPTVQDCMGAIPVCFNTYNEYNGYTGVGNISDIPTSSCPVTCMSAGERNSVWYTFTVQNTGWFDFRVTPWVSSDDYDWALFNLTTDDCSSLLNTSVLPYLEVSCNWSADGGITGANSLTPTTSTDCWGAGAGANNPQVWVTAGSTYYLNISNYTGYGAGHGYQLDMTHGSAIIYDNVRPYLMPVANPTACGVTTLTITLSENVLCSTVSASDFTIAGQTVTAVNGSTCAAGGTMENTYTLTLSPGLSAGTHTVCINGLAGHVADLCGNLTDPANASNCRTITVPGVSTSASASPLAICAGTSSTLTASGSTSYSWSDGLGSGNPVTTSPGTTTTYTVTGTTGGCTSTATATVTVSPGPTVGVTASVNPICNTASTTLTATGATTYSWSGGLGSGAAVSAAPATTTTYTVTGTTSGCTGSAAITITVNPKPVVTPTATPAAICAGASSSLSSTSSVAGTTYAWMPGSLSGTPVSVSPGATTNYTVTGTAAGCTGSATVSVTVNPVPVVTPTATPAIVCAGTSSSLSSTSTVAGTTYAWMPGSLSGTPVSVTPGATTTYTVTGTAAGCTDSESVTVTVNALPVVAVTPASAAICSSQSTSLTASGASTYGWSPASGLSATTGSAVTADPTTTTTYTVTGDLLGCTDSQTVTVNVTPTPSAAFNVNPVSGCNMIPVTATYTGTASGGATYNWNFDGGSATPGSGAGPHTITFSSQGTYDITLSVTENGCTSVIDTVTVSIGGVDATASIIQDVLCASGNSGQATVTVVGGAQPISYAWNTTPAQLSQNAVDIGAGTYIVTVTDDIGCTDIDSVTLVEPLVLTADITDSIMVDCFGDHNGMAEVTANGGVTPYAYTWATSPSTTNTAIGFYAGNYTVTITDHNGCEVVVPFSISQNPQLNINMQIHDEGCAGNCDGEADAVVTGGAGPYSYLWSPGTEVTQAITVCPGNYVVTVTDQFNCTATNAAVIMTNTIINAEGTATPVEGMIPLPVSFSYTGSGAVSYSWDFGDGSVVSTLSNPFYTYTVPGTYTVVLTVNSGVPDFCIDVYTIEIIVVGLSAVEIPNVYTPNGDGFNDSFMVISENLETEKMVIFNRWGREVYRWGEVHGAWNGIALSGHPAADGEYYYVYDATGYDGKEYHFNGTVTLLR